MHPSRPTRTEPSSTAADERTAGREPRSAVVGERQAQQRLLHPELVAAIRADWNDLRLEFVDDPRRTTEKAEKMLRDIIDTVRDSLDRACDRASEGPKPKKASTEELRERMHAYEQLFERMGVHLAH